jgi:hypothetical protein
MARVVDINTGVALYRIRGEDGYGVGGHEGAP